MNYTGSYVTTGLYVRRRPNVPEEDEDGKVVSDASTVSTDPPTCVSAAPEKEANDDGSCSRVVDSPS